jgi:hypothetical protein
MSQKKIPIGWFLDERRSKIAYKTMEKDFYIKIRKKWKNVIELKKR